MSLPIKLYLKSAYIIVTHMIINTLTQIHKFTNERNRTTSNQASL